MKGFMLSFHQGFMNLIQIQKVFKNIYERNTDSCKTILARGLNVSWKCWQFSIRDSGTHSYCMANFVIGNFVGTKYFQTFAFYFHLGPVSTIFDWVFLQQRIVHIQKNKYKKKKKRGMKLTVGLILDQRQPSLVVIGQWGKLIYIHASCFQAGTNAYIQTLTDNSRRAEIPIQIQTCSRHLVHVDDDDIWIAQCETIPAQDKI